MTTSALHLPSADGKDECILGVVIAMTVAAMSGVDVDVEGIFTGETVAVGLIDEVNRYRTIEEWRNENSN